MVQRDRAFRHIYRTNAWRGVTSRSGPGSSPIATAWLSVWLPTIVAELEATSVLDAACGDGAWMPDLPGYVGADIVPAAVAKSRRRHPDRSYVITDLVSDVLPKADVVFSRDTMQHLPLADCAALLANFRKTGARWLIASSHRAGDNVEVPVGAWYPINLEAEPFALGAPTHALADGYWDEGERYPDKIVGVWSL